MVSASIGVMIIGEPKWCCLWAFGSKPFFGLGYRRQSINRSMGAMMLPIAAATPCDRKLPCLLPMARQQFQLDIQIYHRACEWCPKKPGTYSQERISRERLQRKTHSHLRNEGGEDLQRKARPEAL
jgi:hypothetical protein